MKVKENEIEVNGETYIKKSAVNNIEPPKGDYFVVRTDKAGVHAGYIDGEIGHQIKLKNSRRLYYWDGAATLSQVAGEGIQCPGKCKFPQVLPEITLLGVIEVIPCTEKAKSIIESVAVWRR